MDWTALISQLSTGNVLGAVGTAAGGVLGAVAGTAAKGSLVGGTVTHAGGGLVFVKTSTGKEVAIRRKRTRRFHGYRSRGDGMEKYMKLALMKSLIK